MIMTREYLNTRHALQIYFDMRACSCVRAFFLCPAHTIECRWRHYRDFMATIGISCFFGVTPGSNIARRAFPRNFGLSSSPKYRIRKIRVKL